MSFGCVLLVLLRAILLGMSVMETSQIVVKTHHNKTVSESDFLTQAVCIAGFAASMGWLS